MNVKHGKGESSGSQENSSKKIRVKRPKPLSMNETLLNKIVKDSITVNKKINYRNGLPINNPRGSGGSGKNGNSSNSSLNRTVSEFNQTLEGTNNGHNLHHQNNPSVINVNLMGGSNNISGTKSAKGSLPKSTFKANNNKSSSLYSKKNSKISLLTPKESHPIIEMPLPSNKNLNKIPSNGLDSLASGQRGHLKTEVSISSLNTEKDHQFGGYLHTHTLNNLNSINSTGTSFKSDNFKLNEELLEFKLNNSKLKNEINILNEKIKTFKQVVNMKSQENDLIRSKYSEMIEEYKIEIEKLKKVGSEHRTMCDIVNKQNTSLKSTLGIMIDLMEIFIAPRFSNTNNTNINTLTRQSMNVENISASYSIDIYDSYHNDEERRCTMIEQIQGLLVSKLNVMKNNLGLNLDKEIERIKNWNIKATYIYNNEVSISNLKISKQNESSESLRKMNSNDFFDLSTSNHLLGQSPKFNSVELSNEKKIENKKEIDSDRNDFHNFSLNKKTEEDNQLLNDSFLKDLKQNDSFCDDRNGSLIQITNSNLNTCERKAKDNNFEMNILDCSIIDLNVENMMNKQNTKEAKMLFNDDPTEFNMEMNGIQMPEIRESPEFREKEKDYSNYLSLQGDKFDDFIEGTGINMIFPNNKEQTIPIILKPIVNTELPGTSIK